MMADPTLHDDPETLKALVQSMAAKAAAAEALADEVRRLTETNRAAEVEIARLTSILKTLQRGRFGKRSETLGSDAEEQHAFVFEEVETGIAAVEAALDSARSRADRPVRAPRPRKGFAAHLERVEEIIEPEIPPEYEGREKIRIGEGEAEKQTIQ